MMRYEQLVVMATVVVALGSWAGYLLGAGVADRPALAGLGRRLYRQKLDALSRAPLNRYAAAVRRGDLATGTLILAALILAKSLFSGLLGLLVVPYLPLAMVLIPALARAADVETGPTSWLIRVSALQMASHGLAAAVGFAATLTWLLTGRSPLAVASASSALTAALLLGSAVTGVLAARLEAVGHIRHGYLPVPPPASAVD